MGLRYTLSRTNVAFNTANDFITIIGHATRSFRIHRIAIQMLGTASLANSLQLATSSGGTTPGGALTPGKQNSALPAAGFTNATTWSAQPTLGEVKDNIGCNSNGGVSIAQPGAGTEWEWQGGQQASLRPSVGTGTANVTVWVEEF